ncbi:hypothetical protein [Brucella pituitosa]|uniref:Uncharacterized protein n=1 Tax=Brucella pituitosa TaxID=571256 RepID=A0A643EXD8_9HYPH|nr:hypothetical protein [Brucella pituitosa]KAB0570574.1 hypothetical protein F7Q93_15145 [Brucella pituitosa]
MNHPTIAPAHIAGMNVQFVRRSIADEIERLISILDQIDGDCDLEHEPLESNFAGSQFGVASSFRGDELELCLSDIEDDESDFEPDEEGGYEEETYDGATREYWEARA